VIVSAYVLRGNCGDLDDLEVDMSMRINAGQYPWMVCVTGDELAMPVLIAVHRSDSRLK
jgi:hypothetical protein